MRQGPSSPGSMTNHTDSAQKNIQMTATWR